MKSTDTLYEGLPKEYGGTCRSEAVRSFGKDRVEKSEQAILAMGGKGFDDLRERFAAILNLLYELRDNEPESGIVQQAVSLHYAVIRRLWGSESEEDPQAEAYAGLGELYVSDDRYITVNGEKKPEFAHFLRKAMRIFSDAELR